MTNTLFVERVQALVGKPYSECDCKDVIAKALGIKFAGTNWLWRSVNNSPKYRYLSERFICEPYISELIPGDILFKIRSGVPKGYEKGPDAHHVSVYVGNGKIIHSSVRLGVHVDDYKQGEWQAYGRMKQVEYIDDETKFDPDLSDHEMIKALYEKFILKEAD